jgi:AcrR family transcriptional regulator
MLQRPHPQEPRRRDASRRAILDATQALLLEGGAESVSIRRVSARCGYKAPTIYHHFRDKTGLLDALIEERFADLLERLQQVPRHAEPAHYLRQLARAFVEFGLENPTHYALLSTPRSDPEKQPPSAEAARELVFGALREVAESGALRTPDLESAFQLTWVVLHGVLSLRISRPSYAWCDDLVELALDVIDRGLLGKETVRS